MHRELSGRGLSVITVALDRSAEDARPFIEKAAPEHPSLIDVEHRVADLYHIINVSTAIWIDEDGRIARPNAIEYGSNLFKEFHGLDAGPHLAALRDWVDGAPAADAEDIRQHQMPPTPEEQNARTEFALAWYLHRDGRTEAAERHFQRAGELSPFDWTIRRGSMPIRGLNPMGPDFFAMFEEWKAAGMPSYASEAARRTHP
jgi:hypothetical protein